MVGNGEDGPGEGSALGRGAKGVGVGGWVGVGGGVGVGVGVGVGRSVARGVEAGGGDGGLVAVETTVITPDI